MPTCWFIDTERSDVKVTEFVKYAKKAVLAAVAVAVAIQATSGDVFPETVKGWAGVVISTAAAFGIVYKARNKEV